MQEFPLASTEVNSGIWGMFGGLFQFSTRRNLTVQEEERNTIVKENDNILIDKLCANLSFNALWRIAPSGIFPSLNYDNLLTEGLNWIRSNLYENSSTEQQDTKIFSLIASKFLLEDAAKDAQIALNQLTLDQDSNASNMNEHRLICDKSKVEFLSPLISMELKEDAEFRISDLPDDIIISILNHSDMLDIFSLTLVSKNWKRSVYNNSKAIKRAEYTLESHLIRLTNQMNSPENDGWNTHQHDYCELSWCLLKWCCTISNNLETLILSIEFPYKCFAYLLHLCPRLKILQLDKSITIKSSKDMSVTFSVHLPNLEVFCHGYDHNSPITELNRNLLASSDCLKAFRGFLCEDDILFIERHKPLESVFGNLIALDLGFDTLEVLETLTKVESWQLRYLRINHTKANHISKITRVHIRNALDQLLPKLKKLKIWIGSTVFGTSNRTVQLMTKLELNICFAVFCRTGYVLTDNDEEPVDPQTLTAFSDALRFRCQDLNLSESKLVMYYNDNQEMAFQEADTMFTSIKVHENTNMNDHDYTLNHLKIKQYLGMEF